MSDLSFLNPLRWKKSFLISILAGFLIIWFGFLDNYSIYTRYQLSKEKAELKQQIELLQRETESLETRIQALQTDSSYLERIAREDYGMRKPGETIYQIKRR
ncbi:MAG: septum formation initiator family protein [Balneolales bacterium]|nr:septum formation initiator family protein [Balneolales bacterium]